MLWCFFLYQVLKPSSGYNSPGDRYINFERDPNLDRKSIYSASEQQIDASEDTLTAFLFVQLPANPREPSYERRTSMRQTPKTPIEPAPHCLPLSAMKRWTIW